MKKKTAFGYDTEYYGKIHFGNIVTQAHPKQGDLERNNYGRV